MPVEPRAGLGSASVATMLCGALLGCWLSTAVAFAQEYPTRPIKLIDELARGKAMEKILRQ